MQKNAKFSSAGGSAPRPPKEPPIANFWLRAWQGGLLFTCLSTHCLHAKIATGGLDLNNFLLALSRFTNLRGKVGTIFCDNASTFFAAANVLPGLLDSTEFADSVRQKGINWVKISPHASS